MKKEKTQEDIMKQVEIQKNREKIANMVRRNAPELIKCSICGSTQAKILHNDNEDEPYMINFLCNNCRSNKELLAKAQSQRFDVRKLIEDKKYGMIYKLDDADVIKYIKDYLTSNMTIGDYCKKCNFSRYYFDNIISKYEKIRPEENIRNVIKDHAYSTRNNNVRENTNQLF